MRVAKNTNQNIWGNGLPVASQIIVNVWAVGNRGLISTLSRLIIGGTANDIYKGFY